MDETIVYNLLRDIRDTQLHQAETTARIEANVEALSGPQGRVTKLEQSAARQWWYSTAIAPAFVFLHALVRRMGVNV